MLQIKRLKIEGFRGFREKSPDFVFSTPGILLYGDNHQGKSSLLNAVEWCLYADQCVGQKSGIRERVGGWEVINRDCPNASVELVIEADRGDVTIKRVEFRGKGKKGRNVEVELPDSSIKEGDDAEREIASLVRLSFRDFATTVYQHQETIRAIVIQTPSERSDAIDRLLGLIDYRDILDAIKRSGITDAQKEVVNQFDQFRSIIEQSLRIRQEELEQKKRKAIDSGLDENQLNERKLLEVASDIRTQTERFASELGIAASPISCPTDWENTQAFTTETKSELDRLWYESPDVKEQVELSNRKMNASRIKTSCETQKTNVLNADKALQEFEQINGSHEKIDEETTDTQNAINAIDDEIGRLNPKAKLVEQGIALLETAVPPYPSNICPLCGASVPNLLDHLKREWAERIEIQVRELKDKQNQLAKKKIELEVLRSQHEHHAQEVKKAKDELIARANEAAEFLNKELTDRDDPASLLGKEISQVDERLEMIENAIKNKRQTLNTISEWLDKVNLLYEVIELQEKIGKIQTIEDTNEYKQQEEIRDALSVLVADVELLAKITRESMNEEAKSKMNAAAGAIDSYFRKIVENPAIEGLQVQITEDSRTGGNFYTFHDQKGEELNPILSQGDLNALALSMFLGLVKAYSHPIGFIMMDDPSQSLGTLQKKRLADVIDEVCQERNVIISTMDTELQEFLQSGLTKAKTIYEFSNWHPETGANVIKKA